MTQTFTIKAEAAALAAVVTITTVSGYMSWDATHHDLDHTHQGGPKQPSGQSVKIEANSTSTISTSIFPLTLSDKGGGNVVFAFEGTAKSG